MKDTKKNRCVLVVAPDPATTGHLARFIAKHAGVEVETAISKKTAKLRRFLLSENATPLCAVLVPSDDQGPPQIEVIRQYTRQGIPCLIWDASHGEDGRGGFVTMRLAEQAGARPHKALEVIAEAVRLLNYFGGAPDDGVVLNGRRSSLVGTRITDTLLAAGLKIKRSVRARPNTAFLSLGDDGRVTLSLGERAPLEVDAFETTFAAMELLSSKLVASAPDEDPKTDVDKDAVSFIVKPPPRVLSEVTSKRLLAGYGVEPPYEHLCSSQSEAVRIASEMKDAVTLKLVRPEFSSRHHTEAISRDVQGQAAVKREFNRLMLLSEGLGPPKALGVLVAKETTIHAAIRAELKIHAHFGRLLILEQWGERRSPNSGGVLPIPCSYSDVRVALSRTLGDVDQEIIELLCRDVYRLSICVTDLASRIDRLEVDPLAVVSSEDAQLEALALDATVGIAEKFDFSIPALP